MIRAEKCRICGSADFKPKITKKNQNWRSDWVECGVCGVQRINPYPTKETLSEYYQNYCREKPLDTVDHEKRFSAEYNDTVFNEYEYSLRDLNLTPGYLASVKILDFGCANGVFLDYMHKHGGKKENLSGLDISEDFRDKTKNKGYKVYAALNELTGQTFDSIFLWDVIEHLEDPKETIKNLKKVMKPGSKILIQTPRIGLLSDLLKENFDHYIPLEHIHLFPRETLLKLFKDLRFKTLATSSFGANAPVTKIREPFKSAYDRLAKATDNGVTQLALFELI